MAHMKTVQSAAESVEELKRLILDYYQLKAFYANTLGEFSAPVPYEFPEEGDTEAWRERNGTLAVHKPFYHPFRQVLGDGPSAGQRKASEFLDRYGALRRRLEDYCSIYEATGLLSALRPTDVNTSEGEGIVRALALHIDHLKRALSRIAPDTLVDVRIETELPALLRDARKRRGHTQQTAADEMKVSLDSVKTWEAGKHRPEGDNRSAVERYIRKAFLSGSPETPPNP